MAEFLTPYHPAVVHLPIALLLTAVAADVLGKALDWGDRARSFSWRCLGLGLLGALLSAPLGYWDMLRFHHSIEPAVEDQVHWHMYVGFALAVFAALVWVLRFVAYERPKRPLALPYLVTALIAAALVLYQGWLGGELVFSHGVGVKTSSEI